MNHRLALARACRSAGLTDRQAQVLIEVSEGRTLEDAAFRLGIALNTAKIHMSAARERVGATTTVQLLALIAWPADEAA